jgi:hypothetical protein
MEFPNMFTVTNDRGKLGIRRNVEGVFDGRRWDRSVGNIRKVGKESN